MKKIFISFVIVVVTAITFAFSSNGNNDLKSKLENLSGTYTDAKPYNYGKAFGNRVFTFDKGKWTLLFTLSLDPEMKIKIFEFRTYGTYKLQGKSGKVDGTYDALFLEEKKFIKLKTADENLIKAFNFSACEMQKDIEKDISETGCSAWKPVQDCPGDYDLLSLDKNGKLYFGERPADNDMCSPEKRPATLTPPVIKSK